MSQSRIDHVLAVLLFVGGGPRRQSALSCEKRALGLAAEGKDASPYAFHSSNTQSLELRHVTMTADAKPSARPVLKCDRVNRVVLENVTHELSTASQPFRFLEVGRVQHFVTLE